jgi:ribosome biogenesis GTPase
MLPIDLDPTLERLGWTPFFQQQCLSLEPPAYPAAPERIVLERRSHFVVVGSAGPRSAVLSGKLKHELPSEQHPAVGDWVLATPGELGRIEHVFERSSAFVRQASGRGTVGQVVAANVDVAFVVAALAPGDVGNDALLHALSPQRLERYVIAVKRANVRPIVVVNKADVRDDAAALVANATANLRDVEVVLASASSGFGLSYLRDVIGPSRTVVLVGSSGVGKSTLANRLLERDAQVTSPVRDDGRGKHTTTHRELFVLPHGGVLIDTPGMRELALWASEDDEATPDTGFDDIDVLAASCQFANCGHSNEPGCAVRAAVEAGDLPRERLERAQQLRLELLRQKERQNGLLQRAAKQRNKTSTRLLRTRLDEKGRR